MKYIITGATSFIGSTIVNYLVSKGEEVIAICRKNSKNIDNISSQNNVAFVYLDYNDLSALPYLVGKSDIFLNFAWIGSSSPIDRNNSIIQQQNIELSIQAMRVAKEIGCHLFVDSGSQAEYGCQNSTTSEEAECKPITEYGKAKLETYQRLCGVSQTINIGYVHLRIFSIYGVNDHKRTLVSSCIQKMLNNEPVILSDCTQNWNFLFNEDAAQMIVRLAEELVDKFPCDVYNIASLDTRQLKEFIFDIQDETNSQSKLAFGAIQTGNACSINPSIKKVLKSIGEMNFISFKEGLNKILVSQNESI